MKKAVLFTIIFCLFSLGSYAQVKDPYIDNIYFQKNINSSLQKTTEYSEIEGSPYLSEDFIKSKVYFREDSIFLIPLRYNIFDKSMEYKKEGKVFAISNPEIIQKIEMDKWVFVYYHNNKDSKYNSYYELLVSGKIILLAKKDIGFRKAEPPKAIVESKPAKFFSRKDTYHIINNSSFPQQIKNKKSLSEIFKDQNGKLESFIKREKLSYKKREDLVRLVEYYNNLK